MGKVLLQALLISPAILIAGCVISPGAIAGEVGSDLQVRENQSQFNSKEMVDAIASQVPSLEKTAAAEVQLRDRQILQKSGTLDWERQARRNSLETGNSSELRRDTLVSQLSEETIDSQENSSDSLESESMEQVTSVSQLRDVQPTDWAFQALQSLVERYGCIEGYPDRTYRGNRAMTRYEFAAGLNKCLDRIQELIAALPQGVSKEDLARLQRLQEEFAAEIATLRGRVDALEARVNTVESQQFSTTTKLSGVVAINLSGATAGDDVKAEGFSALPFTATRVPPNNRPFVRVVRNDPSITMSYLAWLTFNTSFTGKDRLVTKLVVSNGQSPSNVFASAGQFNTTGVAFLDQIAGIEPNKPVIGELFYTFPANDKLRLIVGPRINWYLHFDFNPFTLPFNGAGTFNSINSTLLTSTKRGAGAVIEWNITKQLDLRAAYLTQSIEFLPGPGLAADPNRGLFNGGDTITGELTFKPSQTANIRLLYQHSNIARNQFGQIAFQPIVGVADDGFGGRVKDATSETFGVNFDWLITRRFAIFGRYYYSTTHIDPVTPGRREGDINAQNIQAGLAFPDLGRRGALATISFIVPFDVLNGRRFLVSGGGNGGTQYDFEFNYFFPITPNIAVVPAFYFSKNINNFDDNPTVYSANVRTLFTF